MLREKLERSQLKTKFFSNLSHELKTPLNLIFSSLQMMDLYRQKKLRGKANEKFIKYISIVKQNSRRLLRLVNNLVDITKIDADAFDLKLTNCDIVDFVRRTTFSAAEYIESNDRNLEFNSEIEERVIAFDPFNLERVLLNLLSNAVKFTEEGDKISVNIFDSKEEVSITVKDTGIGIEEDKQDIIFERFGQVNKSFTRNNEGSGMGLSIVKLLVEMHNGEVKVESKYGKGSEFIVTLPARKIPKEESAGQDCRCTETLTDRVGVEFSDIYD